MNPIKNKLSKIRYGFGYRKIRLKDIVVRFVRYITNQDTISYFDKEFIIDKIIDDTNEEKTKLINEIKEDHKDEFNEIALKELKLKEKYLTNFSGVFKNECIVGIKWHIQEENWETLDYKDLPKKDKPENVRSNKK